MIPNVYRYPVDLTGDNNDNYITGEVHAIGTSPVRAVAPTAGSFYAAGLVIMDAFTQKTLTTLQYTFQFLHTQASLAAGQEVWGVLLITDPTVSPNISISYQAFGGPDAQPETTLGNAIKVLALDNRGVSFQNITGFPDTVTPVPHMHWVGDTYDWDYVVTALEICLNAMGLAEAASYDTTLVYIDQQRGLRDQDIAAFANALLQHIQNYQNPHQLTLTQVDVYSTAQVNTNIAAEATLRTNADAQVNSDITAHATNYSNPHIDTADDIGGYDTDQTDANLAAIVSGINATLASDALDMTEHIQNTNNPHKVTLVQLNGQTTTQINASITAAITPIATQMSSDASSSAAHIANRSNPHQLTISQIGAWDSADTQVLSNNVAAHEVNYSNPHGVSAAQASTWTAAQITNSIAASYSSPVGNALNSQANTINAHTGNLSNPHGVTPYQIGGWEYGDWLNALNGQRAVLSYS
jgi:hypothetical protein